MSDPRCKCSLAISLTGDGCRYCQPQEHIDRLGEWLDEARQEAEQAEARVAELSNLCERLQHCAQGFYVDQSDYGHMEAIMKDYHWIMRASKPWRDAYIKRVQAEAVEAIIDSHSIKSMSGEFIWTEAAEAESQRLRQQADELERLQPPQEGE